jgi:hypothetical protein
VEDMKMRRKTRYWKIAPGSHGFLWVEQRDNGCIAIGWNETGDLDKYRTEEKIRKRFNQIDWGSKTRPNQLLTFYFKVNKGDKVIASSGKHIFGVGTAIGKYKYDEQLYYKHSKPVRWEITFWEPLNVEDLKIPNELKKKLGQNRTIVELKPEEWTLIDNALNRVHSPFQGLNNFEGICRAPQTEQETIILFSKLSQHLKMKIESVGKKFPDAYIRVKKGDRWITKPAEFEVYSSHFAAHGHLKQMAKGRECEMIICWKDDWKDKPKNLEVIELSKEMEEII